MDQSDVTIMCWRTKQGERELKPSVYVPQNPQPFQPRKVHILESVEKFALGTTKASNDEGKHGKIFRIIGTCENVVTDILHEADVGTRQFAQGFDSLGVVPGWIGRDFRKHLPPIQRECIEFLH